MQKILVVVDMQNDFITGALGTKEAVSIVPRVVQKAAHFDGRILFTRDTHGTDYSETQEGRFLPVAHCIKDTEGFQIHGDLIEYCKEKPVDKETFGSVELGNLLRKLHKEEPIESITLVGLCTDICVISNALLIKAFLPEIPVIVDASCCAGVTPQSHENALQAMKACQIIIEAGNEA